VQYPIVTEKPSTREAVAHDTFIDGLTMEPAAEEQPAPPAVHASHHTRRRRRAAKLAAAITRA
jgi:hypothetical protein